MGTIVKQYINDKTRDLRVTAIIRSDGELRIVLRSDDDAHITVFVQGGVSLRDQLAAIMTAVGTEAETQPSRYVVLSRRGATELLKRLDVARANVDDAALCVEQIEKVRDALRDAGVIS